MRSETFGRRAGDEGFTLLEVLVALTVLSVAMAGLGTFFVSGAVTVAQQRDLRNAMVLASNALEQVRALEESALLDGRGQAAVENQFRDAENGPFASKLEPYFDNMKREWAPGATGGADAALPTEPKDFTVGTTKFTQNIFVGPCEVYIIRGDECEMPLPLDSPRRPTDSTTILEYFRVVVLINWNHKSCTANTGQCSHITSTLVSRKGDEAAFSNKRGWPAIRKPYMPVFYRYYNKIIVQMKATGGNLPNRWSAENLPDGLSIDPLTGRVFGTPKEVGTWTYKTTDTYVKVVENEPPAGSNLRSDNDQALGLIWRVVEPPKIAGPAPRSYAGDPVNLSIVTDPTIPYKEFKSADLPKGLTLNPKTGAITGTATKTYTATIVAVTDLTDDYPLTFTHTVYPKLTMPPIPDQEVRNLSGVSLPKVVVEGGDGVYKFTESGLPAGLHINPTTGVISGVSSLIPGRYLPTITVTDGIGGTVSRRFALVITAPNALNVTSPTTDMETPADRPTSLKITTDGGPTTKVTLISSLPPGLRWNNGQDTISGTPTEAGEYPITLSVTSVVPLKSTTFTFLWTVTE